MTKGQNLVNKVHYKGNEDDFLVMIEDPAEYEKWKGDKSVALSSFMGPFKVFVTHKQGAQGQFDEASKAALDSEFGTDKPDDAIQIILEKGNLQQAEHLPNHSGRGGDRNETQGPRQAH